MHIGRRKQYGTNNMAQTIWHKQTGKCGSVDYTFVDVALHMLNCLCHKITSGYLDLVQRLEFGVDNLQKNAVYQIE